MTTVKNPIRLIVGIVCFVALGASALSAAGSSNDISVTLQFAADSATVGDRVPVLVHITHPDTLTFSPLEGEVNLGDLFVIGSGVKREGSSEEGMVHDTLLAWVIPFKTDTVAVPPLKLFYETVSGLKGEARSDSSFIYVKSILPEQAGDIMPIKPNIRAPSDIGSYILLAGLVCLLAVVAFAVVHMVRRRRRKKPAAEFVPPSRPAHEIAFEQFDRIASMNLLSEGKFKEYYSLVSEVARIYIGNRYRFETLDLTTAELVREMRGRTVPTQTIKEFEDFLRRCDLVKFAKFVPPYDEMESAIDVGRELVRSTMERPGEEELVEQAGVVGGDG